MGYETRNEELSGVQRVRTMEGTENQVEKEGHSQESGDQRTSYCKVKLLGYEKRNKELSGVKSVTRMEETENQVEKGHSQGSGDQRTDFCNVEYLGHEAQRECLNND